MRVRAVEQSEPFVIKSATKVNENVTTHTAADGRICAATYRPRFEGNRAAHPGTDHNFNAMFHHI
jgi:hypothetical protein